MPRPVAVIGSRDYPRWQAVHAYLARLGAEQPGLVVRTGNQRGVCASVRANAARLGLTLHTVHARYRELGAGAEVPWLAELLQGVGGLVVFHDGSRDFCEPALELAARLDIPAVAYDAGARRIGRPSRRAIHVSGPRPARLS